MDTVRQWGKIMCYGGLGLLALGLIVFAVQDKTITTLSISLLVAGYGFTSLGGCGWLFLHSLIGFRNKDMIVTGDEIAPTTRYRGNAARAYGVIGMILAVGLFLLSIIPIFFIVNVRS